MAQHDHTQILEALSTFAHPGEVFELRILHKNGKRKDSGYFDSPLEAANAICALQEAYAGLYFTPNPARRELLARSYNRLQAYTQFMTSDADICSRRWLLIDLDPKRPSGISSTDMEAALSIKKAYHIMNYFKIAYGFPDCALVFSGNGCHLDYKIDLPNTDEIRDLIHLFLQTLKAKFNDTVIEVDVTSFNASRIWRVPGTWARKGDSIPDRPHRLSYIIQKPSGQLLSKDKILAFISDNPQELSKSSPVYHTNKIIVSDRLYRPLNDTAMSSLSLWVPVFFPTARIYKEGFRVSSADLGLDYEEDLTINPYPLGIKYFGVHDLGDDNLGRRTPVRLLAELVFNNDVTLAAKKLAEILKCPLTEFDDAPITTPIGLELPGLSATKIKFDFSKIPTMQDLAKIKMAPQQFIVKGLLPTGNMLLASRPKMRKTFWALQLGMAVASGGKFMDWETEKSDVLMLALEDSQRRLKSRVELLNTFNIIQPDLSGFRYWTGGIDISPSGKEFISNPEEYKNTYDRFPKGEAGIEALHKFLDEYPKTRLIIIDTFARFRDTSRNNDIYQRDYDAMMPLTRLASDRGVLIIPVMHDRKGQAGVTSADHLEDVTGSAGITGGSDGVIGIKGSRGAQGGGESRKLLVTGRDIPYDMDIDMEFDAERGGWFTSAKQNIRNLVLDLLTRYPFLNQKEIADLLPEVARSSITRVLTTLKFENVIDHSKNGYSIKR